MAPHRPKKTIRSKPRARLSPKAGFVEGLSEYHWEGRRRRTPRNGLSDQALVDLALQHRPAIERACKSVLRNTRYWNQVESYTDEMLPIVAVELAYGRPEEITPNRVYRQTKNRLIDLLRKTSGDTRYRTGRLRLARKVVFPASAPIPRPGLEMERRDELEFRARKAGLSPEETRVFMDWADGIPVADTARWMASRPVSPSAVAHRRGELRQRLLRLFRNIDKE